MRKLILEELAPYLTRREMLKATGGVGLALALDRPGVAAAATETGKLLSLDLGGRMWTLREDGKTDMTPATIPGSTYTNLLAAKKIPDPYYGENSGKVQWVAQRNWLFERTFAVPAEVRAKKHVELVCHGLDTLATLWLNGVEIGRADNMFRKWTFDIKPHLRPGENHLCIRFETLAPYVAAQRAAYQEHTGVDLPKERSWVRKAPYMWGWDWCRPLLTQGIWQKIEVLGYDARITDLGVLQQHRADGSVHLDIEASAVGQTSGAAVRARVMLAGKTVAHAVGTLENGRARLRALVREPALWWPNSMGDQPLYTVTAQLVDSAGVEMDRMSRRIGLRTVEVLAPKDGVAMHVRVNGVPVFVKGADWIPADNMPTRVTPGIIRWYMTKAAQCNFNFIRLWGGGYYEQDELFDLCDQLGIMLQFEFKFANAAYPVKDARWMANLRTEIEQQTLRCRNHPSIVIWSGNNEIEYFKGYYEIFRDVIGGIVHRLVPGAFYEVGSGAYGSGDIHTWGVWHGNQPVESYRKIEGFVTEFGMQAMPVPKTVRAFADAANRDSVHSPVMRYHERDGSGHGIGIIMHYIEADFGKAPEEFADTLWLSQVNQAWALRYGVEHWRRDMPHSMASVIWQFNDCWPGTTWSVVDYCRRWKAALFQARHFFAPILVSGLPDARTGQADIHVTSDRQHDVVGELCWWVTNAQGEELSRGIRRIDIPARVSRRAETLDLSSLVRTWGAANLLVWVEVMVEGMTAARNTLLFGRPKELRLPRPTFTVHASGGERKYDVVIESNVPALWVWADITDTDADYSDNFMDLRRGRAGKIRITLEKPMLPYEFRRRLQVRSIYDIAPDMRA
ncbi:MAG: beta-mannosidase [Steroidobacteraceae bacterium]